MRGCMLRLATRWTQHRSTHTIDTRSTHRQHAPALLSIVPLPTIKTQQECAERFALACLIFWRRRARTFLLMSHTRTFPSAPPVTALPLNMHMLAHVTGPACQPRQAARSSILATFPSIIAENRPSHSEARGGGVGARGGGGLGLAQLKKRTV